MNRNLSEATDTLLKALAKKYIWWKSPDEAARDTRRVVAQIMNVGDFDDVRIALLTLGKEPFREALTHAEPGWFSPKSWAYWHYRFGITAFDNAPPPLPKRTLPE